jgi:hypothetical protein
LNKDKILDLFTTLITVIAFIFFIYWYIYDYEKDEGSYLLIYCLFITFNYVIQNFRVSAFQDIKPKVLCINCAYRQYEPTKEGSDFLICNDCKNIIKIIKEGRKR